MVELRRVCAILSNIVSHLGCDDYYDDMLRSSRSWWGKTSDSAEVYTGETDHYFFSTAVRHRSYSDEMY